MRIWITAHAHTVSAFLAMMAVAILLGATMGTQLSAAPVSALPSPPLPLPPPSQDADLDSYADGADLSDGDAHVVLELQRLQAGDIQPYFLVGTQDDQWRFGEGRELEWPHIVDPDALGWAPGSALWQEEAIRTGAWWMSASNGRTIAETGDLPAPGAEWPQRFWVNVRDDQRLVDVEIQLYDASGRVDRRIATWDLVVDMVDGSWHHGETTYPGGQNATIGAVPLQLSVTPSVGLRLETKQALIEKWTPELRFDEEEQFFPVSGEALEQVHGFSRIAPKDRDLRTWASTFNNARDSYVLLLADFDGDRRIDHTDARFMADVLRTGSNGDRVYANIVTTTDDDVVIQFWFIYMYNFVQDEFGGGVYNLAHKGDREFISLRFDSIEEALGGMPKLVAYSQHYGGIRFADPVLGESPFDGNGTHPMVYVARGSHASFPAPGDDRVLRPALAANIDVFDGAGEIWTPGNYTVELLGSQPWAFGHLWGPPTRYSRDFGTSGKPLLKHGFTYPFIDVGPWEKDLLMLEQDELQPLYAVPT